LSSTCSLTERAPLKRFSFERLSTNVEDVHLLPSTGWPLRVAPQVTQTPEPTPAELAMLRRFDPQGFWTGD